jgi:hypothetical protein
VGGARGGKTRVRNDEIWGGGSAQSTRPPSAQVSRRGSGSFSDDLLELEKGKEAGGVLGHGGRGTLPEGDELGRRERRAW